MNIGLLLFTLLNSSMLKLGICYKILFMPLQFKSHLSLFLPIGGALSQSGHDVHMVVSDSYPPISGLNDTGIKLLTYQSHGRVNYMVTKMGQDISETALKHKGDHIKIGQLTVPPMVQECEDILIDGDLLDSVKHMQFDIAVVDGLFLGRCLYLLPAYLNIPYITMETVIEPWHLRNPALPSFVPFTYSEQTDQMNLQQRLYNTYILLKWTVTSHKAVPALSKKVLDMYPPELTKFFGDLIKRSVLWFFNSDIVLDYPRPTMPNSVDIGGLTIRQPKQLSGELREFMEGSSRGVVVVSFGSILPDLPHYIAEKFVRAFRKIPYTVLWRVSDIDGLDLPENVMTMKWLPQQDILAHPKAKLLISHSGNNALFEALYHKIPVIGFPIFGDQFYNAKRIEYKSFGLWMDIHTFTPDDLVAAVTQIIDNTTYAHHLHMASEIFKDRPDTPQERAVYWIEHVIKHGGGYLRSPAMDMPWYSYLMLDILVVSLCMLSAAMLVILILVKTTLKSIKQCLSKVKEKKL